MTIPRHAGYNPADPYGAMSSDAPVAVGGKRQPKSPRGPKIKKVPVKAHTRKVKAKPPKTNGGTPALDPATKNLLAAAVHLKFGGAEQALGQQLQGNARFTSGVPAWYAQAINEIKGIGASSAAQNGQAIQQAQQYNSPVAATGTPDAAQAANARNNLNSQYAAMLTGNQQANQDFLGRMQAGMQVSQGNTLNQANRERQGLLGQQTQLKGQEGDFKTTFLAQQQAAQAKALIDQEKTNLAAQALGLKVDTLNKVQIPLAQSLSKDRTAKQKVSRTNARTQRSNAKTQRQNSAETKHQHAVQNALDTNKLALDAYMKAHPELSAKSNAKSKFTPTQVRNAREKFRTVQGMLKADYVKKHPEVSIQRLVREKKIDPLLARAVVQTIASGGVDRKTATAYYRAYGHHLRVKDLGEKTVGSVIKFFQNH